MSETFEDRKVRLNQQTLDFHGISRWHENGYTGEGINFLELEKEYEIGGEKNEHAAGVLAQFSLVAPGAATFLGNMASRVTGGEVVRCEITLPEGRRVDFKEFVRANNIHIVGESMGGANRHDALDAYMKETGCIFIGSAGNKGAEGVTGKIKDIGIMVGAINVVSGKISREYYSASGDDELDFAALHGWRSGTSFAAPTVAGMVALILSRYGIRPQGEVYALLQQLSLDAGAPEYDTDFGFGIPVLPESLELEGEKEMAKHIMQMQIDNPEYTLDDEVKLADAGPIIVKGRTLAPYRLIAEAMGGQVAWDNQNKIITIEWEDQEPEK